MKVTDLRIGNYVYDLKLNHIIRFISFHGLCNVESRPDDYEPIPLTEELLLKCGYIIIDENEAGKAYNIVEVGKFINDDTMIVCFARGERAGKFFRKNKEVKSLHQLQNLYSELAEEELEINL